MTDDDINKPARIKSWKFHNELGKTDSFELLIRFFGGGTLALGGELGGELTVNVAWHVPGAPGDLYEVARRINHELGMAWTDPRSGVTHEPPAPSDLIFEVHDGLPPLCASCGRRHLTPACPSSAP